MSNKLFSWAVRFLRVTIKNKSRRNDMLLDFVKDCESRNLTRHTIQSYVSCLKVFQSRVHDPLKVDTNILRDFLDYLKTMPYIRGTKVLKGVSGQTISAYFSAISTYYDYLIYKGEIASSPIIPFRKRYLSRNKKQYNGENSRQLLTILQMKQLINQDMPIEHKALLILLAKTGIRRGELLSIDVDDVDLAKKEIILKPKKKRTNRLVIFDDETAEVLKVYYGWRESRARCPALFISPYGSRMKRGTPNEIISYYGTKLGLHDPNGSLNKKLSPHCFRHFFTTFLRKSGMPREFIQELRGDSRRETIDIYDHIDMGELRESYEECIFHLLDAPVTLHIRDALPQPKQCLPIITRLRLVGESTISFGESTIQTLSALKEAPDGKSPTQITREIKKTYRAVEKTLSRQVKAGRVSTDRKGKYFITAKGIETLDIIHDKIESNKAVEARKPEVDVNKQLLDYIIRTHPEMVNNFFNQNNIMEARTNETN